MWFGLLIVALVLAIAIPIGVQQGKANKKLIEEGKMMPRGNHYAEKGEEFTARIDSFEALSAGLKNMLLPCQMSGNTAKIIFTSEKYSARLYRVAFDESTRIAVYRFEFTSWKTYRGMYEQNNSMNILMTSVEKVFLSLDPNTSVKTYDLDFKTKHSFL